MHPVLKSEKLSELELGKRFFVKNIGSVGCYVVAIALQQFTAANKLLKQRILSMFVISF